MKTRAKLSVSIAVSGLFGLSLLSGCCTQSSGASAVPTAQAETEEVIETPDATVIIDRNVNEPVRHVSCGKSETFERDGITYLKSTTAFPTGFLESSGLLLEKTVPLEVLVGQPFTYEYQVHNLTDCTLHDVTVSDYVTEVFRPESAQPEPAEVDEGMARWAIGDLEPREVVTIIVRGAAREEGVITTCGLATYIPILCETIKVVKADLQITKDGPEKLVICDEFVYTVVVKNTGTAPLTQVRVVETLGDGLTSDGKTQLTFDVGTLQAGEDRTMNFSVHAPAPGEYRSTAVATSAQGVTAEDFAVTTVHEPVLALTCDMPTERFVGRPIVACFTVANTGDWASPGTVVEVPLPSGVNYTGSTADGSLSGSTVVWRIPSLEVGEERELCAQLTGSQVGTVRLTATARGECADPVTSSCSTVVTGIPAILMEVIDVDDPIEVGAIETYVITVTNQGSAPDTNIRVSCEFEAQQEFVSGEGLTAVTGSGQSVRMAPVASLAPKAQATWKVRVKAVSAANVRAKFIMISDQLTRPVEETESTNQY